MIKASDIFGVKKARFVEEYEVKAEWYDEPEDQMLVYMGHEPRPGAKYTIPKDILASDINGVWMTWDQKYGRWNRGERD